MRRGVALQSLEISERGAMQARRHRRESDDSSAPQQEAVAESAELVLQGVTVHNSTADNSSNVSQEQPMIAHNSTADNSSVSQPATTTTHPHNGYMTVTHAENKTETITHEVTVSEEVPTARKILQDAMAKDQQQAWTLCSPNCNCASRRRMVIRYLPRKDTDAGVNPECIGVGKQTSWYWKQHTTGSSGDTPASEFDKGFKADKASSMDTCGTTDSHCTTKPDDCAFAQGGNPDDANLGQYCCDKSMGYCSYHCTEAETFSCPAYDPQKSNPPDGYPGGFDPCTGWPKACYSAQYEDGKSPETP
jgi:hypothetical protein